MRPDPLSSSEFFALNESRTRKKLSIADVIHWRQKLRIHDAYRALFGGGVAPLRPEFAIVLADLVNNAGFDQIGGGISDADLREQQGRKTMVLHLLNRIDRNCEKTNEIHKLLKESDRE